jgi:hypothetical protein
MPLKGMSIMQTLLKLCAVLVVLAMVKQNAKYIINETGLKFESPLLLISIPVIAILIMILSLWFLGLRV